MSFSRGSDVGPLTRARLNFMAELLMHIGNRNYSSSLPRGWLACRLAGMDFDEHIIPIDLASTAKNISVVSPNERVPSCVSQRYCCLDQSRDRGISGGIETRCHDVGERPSGPGDGG